MKYQPTLKLLIVSLIRLITYPYRTAGIRKLIIFFATQAY